jgi:hypothetical protein
MTLSATGDADTPAGGSVCIRCSSLVVDEWGTPRSSFAIKTPRTLKSLIKRRRAAVDMLGRM